MTVRELVKNRQKIIIFFLVLLYFFLLVIAIGNAVLPFTASSAKDGQGLSFVWFFTVLNLLMALFYLICACLTFYLRDTQMKRTFIVLCTVFAITFGLAPTATWGELHAPLLLPLVRGLERIDNGCALSTTYIFVIFLFLFPTNLFQSVRQHYPRLLPVLYIFLVISLPVFLYTEIYVFFFSSLENGAEGLVLIFHRMVLVCVTYETVCIFLLLGLSYALSGQWQRLYLRWLMVAFGLAFCPFVFFTVIPQFISPSNVSDYTYIGPLFSTLSFGFMPIIILFTSLRYQLFVFEISLQKAITYAFYAIFLLCIGLFSFVFQVFVQRYPLFVIVLGIGVELTRFWRGLKRKE
ncbi:hypothetical protein [Dictyobacter arantiisoli]|uniref:Uncharacterized protein n=1 Tax=Dictyobacter arantiisoli TaxID=2014874 RepID=A0A5A5TIJ7_9CHLR|nr:hypothetical protein [Dictyobacter arantiisoli]GCF11227.1 hypothetical protein KDI_47910 [Dictyobacter arantiisoli]